jgi:hypothetical protein
MHTCFCMYQELGMYLHKLVCIIMCEPVSRAQHACACLSASGDSVMIRMCWPVSRAGRVFPCVFTIQEPDMQVQVSARIKSSACTSMIWPVSKLSMYLHGLACVQSSVGIFTFRALCVFACLCICCVLSAYGCTYWGLVMYLLASASIKGCGCICIQWLVSAHTVSLHLLPCIKEMSMSLHFWPLSRAQYSAVFLSLYWELNVCLHVSQISRAWFVSAYVGGYHEHIMFQHVCLHVSSSRHVSACVSARIVSWTSIFVHPQLSVSAASVCTYWKLSKFLHVLVCIQGCAWSNKCGPVSRADKVCLGHDSAYWPILGAERVSACVLTFQEQGMQLHVSAWVEKLAPATLNGFACSCMYLRVPSAELVSSYVAQYQELSMYSHLLACFRGFTCIWMYLHVSNA